MIEILLIFSLSAEPMFINQPDDVMLERKRTHKKRRKIKKPVKGLK